MPYDALDPELLLYVHACLVDSALLFEELTVGRLDDAGRQRFHEEQMLVAEMVLVPRHIIPRTVQELRAYLQDVYDSGALRVTDSARQVAELFVDPPREAEWRPILMGVSRLAFATLPPELRAMYRIRVGAPKRLAMGATFAGTQALRPLLPPGAGISPPTRSGGSGGGKAGLGRDRPGAALGRGASGPGEEHRD